MKKIKHIVLLALTALLLGLASLGAAAVPMASGAAAPAIASVRSGGGGNFNTPVDAPAIASIRSGTTGNF